MFLRFFGRAPAGAALRPHAAAMRSANHAGTDQTGRGVWPDCRRQLLRILPAALTTTLMTAVTAALLTAPAPARAQTYPERPITVVVPYPVGGPVDLVGRIVAEALSRQLGQPVVVENRIGAAGTLGAQRVARSTPDGHTLLVTAQTPITIAQHFSPKPQYDPQRDLMPIARVGVTPVLVLGPGNAADTSLRDLFDRARRESRELNYGAPGLGNEMHLIWEVIRLKAGVKAVPVPYQGTGPGLLDLGAGRIDAMVTAPAAVRNLITEGRVRALAVVAEERLPELPSVPTIAESGVQLPAVPVPWLGLFAPAGTPPAIAERINRAIAAAAAEGEYRDKMKRVGMDPAPLGLAEFAKVVNQYREEWTRVIEAAGIRFDSK